MRFWFALLIVARLFAAGSDPGIVARVQTLLASGDLARAESELQAELRRHPNDATTLNLLGVVTAQRGKYAAAEGYFRKALTLAPGSVSVLDNLGRLYQQFMTGQPDALRKGVEVYRKLVEMDPASNNFHFQLALLLAHNSDCAGSLKELDRISGEAKANSRAVILTAVCQAVLLRPEAARGFSELKTAPQLAQEDILGVLPLLEKAGQAAAARELLEIGRNRGVATAESLVHLASLQEQAKQYQEARATLERVVQMAGVTPEILLGLARTAYETRDYKGTLSYLAHARDLQPDNAAVHFFFGMTAVAMDLPLEAKKSLAEAVRLQPKNPWYVYAYASVLAGDRDASQSIPVFQRYCELRPDDARGRFALAVARYLSSQLAEAQAAFTELANHRETSAGAHLFLGRIAKQENRLAEAESHFRSAVQLAPATQDARAELAHVCIRLRKYQEAKEELRLVLKANPNHYLANLGLLTLYQRTKDPRTEEQAAQLELIKAARTEKEQALWRTIEIHPY